MTRLQSPLLISTLFICCLILYSCKKPIKRQSSSAEQLTIHDMHHNTPEKDIQLTADIPIYHPSKATFKNRLNFLTSENIYIRYNTTGGKKKDVMDYYAKALPENGWEINIKKTNTNRFVIHKGRHHATLRIFEMEQSDSSSTAFSINMVSPKQ